MIEEEKSQSLWKVYKHTNLINGMGYIGITKQTLNNRFRKGEGYRTRQPHGGSRYLYNAIQYYGWENFSHEILYDNLTLEQAKEKEIELIKTMHTRVPEGYNISEGGDGKNVTEESRRLMQLNSPRKRAVTCITTGETFISAAEAGRQYHLTSSQAKHISEVCRHERPFSGTAPDGQPLQWKYFNDNTKVSLLKHGLKRRVYCNETGEEFSTIKNAAEKYKVTSTAI